MVATLRRFRHRELERPKNSKDPHDPEGASNVLYRYRLNVGQPLRADFYIL